MKLLFLICGVITCCYSITSYFINIPCGNVASSLTVVFSCLSIVTNPNKTI